MEANQNNNKKRRIVDMSVMGYGKVPPQAKELEEAVLGGIMLEKRTFDTVYEIIKPEAFYVTANQKIFEAIVSLTARSQPVDMIMVIEELKTLETLDLVGGPYYVMQLTKNVVSTAHIEAHARIVLQKFLQREVIRISSEILSMAYEDSTDVFDLMDFAEEKVLGLRLSNVKSNFTTLQSVLVHNLQRIEELRMRDEAITGVPSGFPDLDKITCGWQNTDLIILAARPSVGKSAFALTIGKNAAKDFRKKWEEDKLVPKKPQKGVGLFSLEMSNEQSGNRILSAESNVFMWRLRNGRLGESELRQLYKSMVDMADLNIYMDDIAALKMADFRSKARKMVTKYNVGLIIFDYLQLGTEPSKKVREQEIAAISGTMKAIAKELKIPVIALSQMSRDFAKAADGSREPQLSDLRESGSLEQDADVVIFLWKPSDDDIKRDPALEETFYAKISKHRNGSSNVKFLGKFVKDTQTHEYLKTVDSFLNPIGEGWTPALAKENAKEEAKLYIQKGSKMNADEGPDELPF